METIYLAGSEQVQNAARQMQSAAEDMRKAAGDMQYGFEQHQRFLTDWLQQYREMLEQQQKTVKP